MPTPTERAPLAYDIASLADVRALFDSDVCVAADVSLGAWRGHQVATELCTQLGVEPPQPTWPSLTGREMFLSCAELIGAGIDAEARGDAATLTAIAAAERVAAAVKSRRRTTLLVLAPRFGLALEREDRLFVDVLRDRLEAPERFVVASAEAAPAPPNDGDVPPSLTALVPGVVEPGLAVASDIEGLAAMRLVNGSLLVAPEARRDPATVARLDYDRLAVAVRSCGWLRAYAHYHGNNVFVDVPHMLGEGWQRFAEGGVGIALRLMERAATCADTKLERALADAASQGIRIAAQRVVEVAAEPTPAPTIPDDLRAFLLFARCYGLVMTGQVDRARPALIEAQALLDGPQHVLERMYLMNVAALALLKAGDHEGALDLEIEVASRIRKLRQVDWRLRYVNAVNIARLHRLRGELDESSRSYDAAFSTTFGSRSESDAIYTNFCLARLEQERGRRREAFIRWLRAALHWSASCTPDALAPRVARALTGRASLSRQGLVEEVSDALACALSESAAATGSPRLAAAVACRSDAEPHFVRADGVEKARLQQALHALGSPGWGILMVGGPGGSFEPRPSASLRLRRLVFELLVELAGVPELRDASAIVVDDRCGQEIPGAVHELTESALRMGATGLSWSGTRCALHAPARSQLEKSLEVVLGPAVENFSHTPSGVTVRFKRTLSAHKLPPQDGPLLDAARSRPSVRELAVLVERPVGPVLERLRLLESAHIVYLTCSEESCTKAGIWLPSRATSKAN
jgi:hypothetical protein